MITRLQRLLSAHADAVSVDRRLTTFELPETGRIHAYAHRAGHHHLVSDAGRRHELSLRLPGASPLPGLALLRRLVAELAGRPLAPLHTVVLSPPVLEGSNIEGVALVVDPELGSTVLQAVGITGAEARSAVLSSTEAITAPLAARDPLLVTLPDRDEIAAAGMDAAPRSEGHDVPTLEVRPAGAGWSVDVEPARLRATLATHLRARLAHGEPLRLRGPTWTIRFERADRDLAELEGDLLRVGLGPAALDALALDPGVGALSLGPVALRFLDEPAAALPPAPPPSVEPTEPLWPFEARRMAEEAAAEQRLEEALALIPLAVQDGSHGLLAELLHVDVLRRLGRTDAARAQLWRTADAWLGGERAQVWNTQWKRLLELATKLKLDPADPRLARARELAR